MLRLPHEWGLTVYLAGKDGYGDSILPRGSFAGAPEDALDCAGGLYIPAWTDTPHHRPGSPRNF